MITHRTIRLLLIVVLGLSLAGCGKSVTQKTTEKALEKATNGQADVDLSNNSVKVNVNGGSWEVGEKVSLPDGFPSDVYVVDGTVKSAVTTVAGKAYSVSLTTTKSVADVKALYTSKLKDDGWTVTATASVSGSQMFSAEKGKRTLTVTIGADQDATVVTLMTSDQTESDRTVDTGATE